MVFGSKLKTMARIITKNKSTETFYCELDGIKLDITVETKDLLTLQLLLQQCLKDVEKALQKYYAK